MKAIVNIADRSVELKYSVNSKDLFPFTQEERNLNFKQWETFQKNAKSKVVCKHTIDFNDLDDWQSIKLFDGRVIDFHYHYEDERSSFDTQKEFANSLFKGYEYKGNEQQNYHTNIVTKVIVKY